MAHNRVISTQATAWLKKIDSQTTICKILLSLYRAGSMPTHKITFDNRFYNNVAHVMPVFCHSWCMQCRGLAIRDADTANAYFALAG